MEEEDLHCKFMKRNPVSDLPKNVDENLELCLDFIEIENLSN